MLKLKNINKEYILEKNSFSVLKNINISFRDQEFVSILGPSGSGKTTLLNIIGGLDNQFSGNLIINGENTVNFKEKNWNSYRNHCIGFIFQNYNLISHISVLDNVMITLKLSGVNGKERKKRAIDALIQVGLKEHINKKPNQLSGGQIQRVAIARALANNSDIILADEPTGALDQNKSIEIMNLIKKIAKNKLVIMVTHNEEIANTYSTRIIKLLDGKIVADSNPYNEKNNKKNKLNLKKTSMSFIEALKLSFHNIQTKKGRTFLISFAASIGIIGVALILSFSNGLKKQMDKVEKDTLSKMPIVISKTKEIREVNSLEEENVKDTKYIKKKKNSNNELYRNNIDKNYIDNLLKENNKYLIGYSYNRNINLPLFVKNDNNYIEMDKEYSLKTLPEFNNTFADIVIDNYSLVKGRYPKKDNEILLVIDKDNKLDEQFLQSINLNQEKISYDQIIKKEFFVLLNDDYYKNNFSLKSVDNISEVINNKGIKLKITGIIKIKENSKLGSINMSPLICKESLFTYLVNQNKSSSIVSSQKTIDYNLYTYQKFSESNKIEDILEYLGDDVVPKSILIYPKKFNDKKKIINYLDNYNKSNKKKILYDDYAKDITSLTNDFMNTIMVVLVIFSSISLIVSSIMIGIITYISVIERTKEIGILRSLGASKKDIKRIFNAETFIIGLSSGIIGIIITLLLIKPINSKIFAITKIRNVALLNYNHAILLIIISILLTLIGGLIPAKIASRKNPVETLNRE